MEHRIRLLSAPLLIAVYVLLAGLISPPVIADTSDPDAAQPGDPVEEGATGARGTAPRPTGLSVTSSDDDSISLSWTSGSDVARYRVEYRKSSSSIWLVRAYTYSASYTASNLDCDTEYYFRVRARGDGDPYSTTYSSASSSVSRTTDDCPSVLPTALAVAAESNSKDLDVTFTRHDVTGKPHFYEFELYRSLSQYGTYSLVDTVGADTSPADFDYQPHGFWYKARGRNCTTVARTACGDWTTYTSAIEFPQPVSFAPAPKNLRSTRSTEDRVYLSWNSVTNAAGYMVEYSSSRSGPWRMAFNGITRTYYIAYGLDCESVYHFRIRARGDGSPYSTDYGRPSVGPISAKTGTCTNPTNLASPPSSITQLTPREKNKIKLDWPSVSGANAYLTERSSSPEGPWSTVRFPATISARNDDVGLECGKTYYYRVRSRGDGSPKSSVYGEPSSTKTAYTAPCVPDDEPAVALYDIADSIEVGGSDAFNVRVTNLPRTKSHVVRLTTTDDAAFDSGCTLRQKDSTISKGYTSDSIFLRLYACDSTEARVEATLLSGSTAVYTADPATVEVTAATMLSASDDTPFLGQYTTLIASSPSPYGTASSYQFQERTASGWTDLATATATRRKSVRAYDEATHAYRVLISYTSGDMKASPALPITWEPITVTLKTSSEVPVSSDTKKRKITLTASTNAPSPFKYQFRQGVDGNFTNLGTLTSSATREVSFTTSGTREFSVEVRPSGGVSRGYSNTIYVTWDGAATLSALVTALDSAIKSDTTFIRLQTDLVNCMNGVTGGAGGTGGGNATSTPPLPGGASGSAPTNTYSSINDILGNYSGDVRDKMEDSSECKLQADRLFDRIEAIAPTKLATLKTGNTRYADILSTPQGQRMESFVSSVEGAKLVAGLLADPPATSSGASGQSPTTGFGCLPRTEPTTLDEKLEDLDCMIFGTPHSFWLNKDANERAFSNYPWMGIGDWKCSEPSPQGPVPSCLKHDVAYASLQKFTGRNPDNVIGGLADGGELDEAWNPRNKSLADSKLYADIMKHGCELESWATRILFCSLGRAFMANFLFVGVGNIGDRAWPVTEDDTAHIGGYRDDLDADSTEYSFFNCDGLVPTTANLSVTQTMGRGFSINWTNSLEGCVPGITIEEIETCLTAAHRHLRITGCTRVDGTPTSAFISLGRAWNGTAVDYVIVESRLYPHRWEYGSMHYQNYHTVLPERN